MYMKRSASVVKWIKNRVRAARARGCVVGLSGGVDSAVVAALCKKAAGARLLCLIMPCGSSPDDMKDAAAVAKKFRLKTKIVDIKPVYRAFLKILPAGASLAASNLKPRLRMAALYYFANLYNFLVVGTGNKSEIAVGYFTKHGDGGADALPLGSFYKSEVYALARELGVPRSVMEKPPSAGLWPGQTDEGEMGVTYEEIERALRAAGRTGRIDNSKVAAMARRSEHKRKPPEIYTEEK
ncbi:MAG: NAD(+) synthetase [Elusimicrobia bacterium HGW-Elusimicrobia-1]|jgi:NAD+ synthase|nr:MAG: NAD(+) synthetase [Elusimicrobia bacterium HGW-Elusimicrobia-1]